MAAKKRRLAVIGKTATGKAYRAHFSRTPSEADTAALERLVDGAAEQMKEVATAEREIIIAAIAITGAWRRRHDAASLALLGNEELRLLKATDALREIVSR